MYRVQSPHVRLVRVPWVLDHQTFGWKDVEVLYVVKLREREGQRVDLGRSLKGNL